MSKFAQVQAQFRQLNCGKCEAPFAPEGVKLLREEKDGEEGHTESYQCTHRMIREVVYSDLGEARLHLLQQRVLAFGTATVSITELF